MPGAGEAGGFEEGVEAAPPSRGAADQPAAQKVSDGSEAERLQAGEVATAGRNAKDIANLCK